MQGYNGNCVPSWRAETSMSPSLFCSLPERTLERLPKAKVKAIIRRTTDYDKEVVHQVDVVPSGSFLAREEPVKKGKTYTPMLPTPPPPRR